MTYIYWATMIVALFSSIPHLVITRQNLDSLTNGEETIFQLVLFRYHFLITFIMFMLIIIAVVLNLVYQGNFQYQIRSWAKSCLLALLFSYVLNSYIYTI